MRTYGYWIVAGVLGSILLLPFLLPELSGTMPHAHCYLWRPDLMWLHGGSDGLIGLAYLAISVTLFSLLYRIRESIPFRWMIFAFGVFIVACGMTHFMSIWTLFEPAYFLSGSIKGVTAVASVITAIALPPLVPRIIATVRAARESEERRRELEVLYERVRVLDAEKSRFFANISHDLRTPITLIVAPGESLLERDDLPEDVRRSLGTIVRNARSLDERVDELLDLSRLEAGSSTLDETVVDAAQVVRSAGAAFSDAARISGIELSVDTPEHLIMRLDRMKIDRVLLNLLGNSLKFTPTGGVVSIRLAPTDSDILIDVVDTGPGIPPEDRGRVFDPYVQIGAEGHSGRGSGLGLSIARSFVELHGGSIEVLDTPSPGTHFRVHLPSDRLVPEVDPATLRDQPQGAEDGRLMVPVSSRPDPTPPPVPESPESDRPTVLVVEDNDEMRYQISAILSTEFDVVAVADANEGLEYLASTCPSVILSDLMMRGIDGEEFLARIRADEATRDVPVVFLSARGDEETRVRLLDRGAQDYISKPFSPRELRTRIAGFVMIDRYQRALKNAVEEREGDLRNAEVEIEQRRQLLENALEDLRVLQRRFDLLWRSNIIAMGISHLDGRISEANDQFLSMLRYSREDLDAGKLTIGSITHQGSERRTEVAISDARDTGIVRPFEKNYVDSSGRKVPVIVGGARIEGTEDEILFVVHDLTEIRRAEMEIRKLNEELEERVAARTSALLAANRDLRAFSYSVSHDLRAPLRAISGFTRFLQEDYTSVLDDTGRDYLSRIDRNVHVMEGMITALLGLSRATREPINAVVHDVSGEIEEIIASLRAADPDRGVDVSWETPIVVEADRALFRIVLENLIHNAWKFTSKRSDGRIAIGGSEAEDHRTIRIEDNGVGFDMKNSGRIFEPFGRLHSPDEYPGTGIGLSTVHTIVRRHFGDIAVTSVPGEGTIFTITLPRPALVEPTDAYVEE